MNASVSGREFLVALALLSLFVFGAVPRSLGAAVTIVVQQRLSGYDGCRAARIKPTRWKTWCGGLAVGTRKLQYDTDRRLLLAFGGIRKELRKQFRFCSVHGLLLLTESGRRALPRA